MATPKKPTPKAKPRVVISGSISASGGGATGTKSVTRGASMAQSPKIVDKKPAAKKAKTTVYKPKQASLVSQASKAAGKVVGRAKTVAREVRDIPTAVGTILRAPKEKAGENRPVNKQKMAAKYDFKKQVGEVKSAITSGTKGTGAMIYGKGKQEYRTQSKKKK